MKDADVLAIRNRIETVLPTLNEYLRRRYLSAEAKAIGYGGISLISRLSGMSRQTLTEGVKELDRAGVMPEGRSRKSGGGRKPVWEKQPGILQALEESASAHTKRGPTDALLWTNKSLRNLSMELAEKGYHACYGVVGEMLRLSGYGLQADRKTPDAAESHTLRNAQFGYINEQCKKAKAGGIPVISIGVKKKENAGNFRNNGKTYQLRGNPVKVPGHDFPLNKFGGLTPFEAYNLFKKRGFVNAGIRCDAAAVFAVESIRRWWYAQGEKSYKTAAAIVVAADCGGGRQNRRWKYELQKFSNEVHKKITVLHYPPGTSKWTKIEHSLFAFISGTCQGTPSTNMAVVVSLIGAAAPSAGLPVICVLDESEYETDIKISDEDFGNINITNADFHGEWNYTIFANL
jgi:hypothetical protein